MKAWATIVASLIVTATAGAAGPGVPKLVSLDDATLRRLNVATAPVRAMTRAPVANGFARVLDPLPLAQLDSDIAAAEPVARASAAEAMRSRALFAADVTVSRRVAETAASQARGDAARLSLLRRRLALEWGPAIARLSDARRGAIIASLASGRSALVRIDSAGGAGQAGLRTATLDLGELGTVSATVLGPARAADARLQSPGLLARVAGPKAALLSTGLTAPARLGGAARSGVFVPAASVLRLDGGTWVYAKAVSNGFRRRRLEGTSAVPGGLFASVGLQPGDIIVISGAAALYAAEHGASPVEG